MGGTNKEMAEAQLAAENTGATHFSRFTWKLIVKRPQKPHFAALIVFKKACDWLK